MPLSHLHTHLHHFHFHVHALLSTLANSHELKAAIIIMSRRNGSSRPKLELKLNLSPPRRNPLMMETSPGRRSATASPSSPQSSCVSSEANGQDEGYPDSPEATSMVLVGCPRCLMYVMLSEEDPKCPKCKSTVLLDFLHDHNAPPVKTRRS